MKTSVKTNLATSWLQWVLPVLLICVSVKAQDFESISLNNMAPPKVEIIYPDEATHVGNLVEIRITIPENWHVNANVAADEFLKPSTLEIEARGIEFGDPIWPAPIKEYSEALDLENLVFKGTFSVGVPIQKLAADYDTSTTNVNFGYQACSHICLAPQTVHASLELKSLGQNSSVSPVSAKPSKKNSTEPWAWLLILAFVGGLLLNLMPCVLPVLFLKLFNLVKHRGESRARLFRSTSALVFGILLSFWVLAGIITLIKAGSGHAGWGFQFQNLGFITFMVVLLSAFAMNLLGAFELFLPGSTITKMDAATHREGLSGAFFSGILMVLLSTPCSAPFLGSAMGFAFTQSIPILFLFFTAAALGLAFPYILVAVFPTVLKIFPKPGNWMVKLQKILGLFLFGTALWLVWVAFSTCGKAGAGIIGAFGIAAVICSYLFGKVARPDKPFVREPVLLILFTGFFLAAWFFAGSPALKSVTEKRALAAAEQTLGEDGWYRYSEQTFQALALEGKPIFVDVTADWCLTCKTNEAVVLSSEAVREIFHKADALLIRADYTLENEEVSALLKSLGRSGVPAYAVYLPKSQTWNVLPEIPTADAIRKALSE